MFGSKSDPEGELAGRIDKKDPGDVFIYVASHGMVKEDDGKEAYLLPVDAKLDDLDKTAYPLQELYEHLGKIGARTIMLMLEANFAKNLDELINPPNLPELEVEAMPVNPGARPCRVQGLGPRPEDDQGSGIRHRSLHPLSDRGPCRQGRRGAARQ